MKASEFLLIRSFTSSLQFLRKLKSKKNCTSSTVTVKRSSSRSNERLLAATLLSVNYCETFSSKLFFVKHQFERKIDFLLWSLSTLVSHTQCLPILVPSFITGRTNRKYNDDNWPQKRIFLPRRRRKECQWTFKVNTRKSSRKWSKKI